MSQFEQHKNAGFGVASVMYAFHTVADIHPPMQALVKEITLMWGMTDSAKLSTDVFSQLLRFEVHDSTAQVRRNVLVEATNGEYNLDWA
jgi:hypothetical protein